MDGVARGTLATMTKNDTAESELLVAARQVATLIRAALDVYSTYLPENVAARVIGPSWKSGAGPSQRPIAWLGTREYIIDSVGAKPRRFVNVQSVADYIIGACRVDGIRFFKSQPMPRGCDAAQCEVGGVHVRAISSYSIEIDDFVVRFDVFGSSKEFTA